MRKKLSLLLIALGLMLSGAGGWEIYTAFQAPDTTVVAESASDETGQVSTSQSNTEEKASKEDDQEPTESNQTNQQTLSKKGEQKRKSVRMEKSDPTAVTEKPSGNSEKPSPSASKPSESQFTVTLSITGDQGKSILSPGQVAIQEGDTVFDALNRATQHHSIQMEYRGSGSSLYVEGIDNLYEFDRGPESGWMYRVNGVFPNKSAGVYSIQKGDRIDWLYTRDLGRDIGAKF
ncbi:DUF4430 domain-containing protein [Melghirimyces algeriensis]|uniref:Transcobalamin-like C-terminal domain-containing protein n=1 Tax=Melghirimyces algeriensis TaxID=910412 RepID=A0A521FG41_9BACL|nr:DUF4430 domain-containing protein [Melghirimyces algeriensis]SMO95157.1 protein of unknown function [Melghirimyces algeriensis]